MSVQDFPPRPDGADFDSAQHKNWLDALRNRQNIDALNTVSTLSSADETYVFSVSASKTYKATVSQIVNSVSFGTVNSVNITGANGISVTGNPITNSGTIALSLGNITPTNVSTSTVTAANIAGAVVATQADQETSTSVITVVTPGRQQFHPSAAKSWAVFGVAGDVQASYNVSSVTDTGTGVATVNFTTNFSSGSYPAIATLYDANGYIPVISAAGGLFRTTTSCRVGSVNFVTGLFIDPSVGYNFVAFGDQ